MRHLATLQQPSIALTFVAKSSLNTFVAQELQFFITAFLL
jgi:hypothetical protein